MLKYQVRIYLFRFFLMQKYNFFKFIFHTTAKKVDGFKSLK